MLLAISVSFTWTRALRAQNDSCFLGKLLDRGSALTSK